MKVSDKLNELKNEKKQLSKRLKILDTEIKSIESDIQEGKICYKHGLYLESTRCTLGNSKRKTK